MSLQFRGRRDAQALKTMIQDDLHCVFLSLRETWVEEEFKCFTQEREQAYQGNSVSVKASPVAKT